MMDRIYVILGLAVLGHVSIICCVIFHVCYKECKKKKTINRQTIEEDDPPIEETYVQSEVVVTESEHTATDQSHNLVTRRSKQTNQSGFSTVAWVAFLTNRINNIMSRGQRQRSSTFTEVNDAIEASGQDIDNSLPSYFDALPMQLDRPETTRHLRQVSISIRESPYSVNEIAFQGQPDQIDDSIDDPPKYDDMFEYTSL